MVKIKKEVIKKWLIATNKNQSWLAERMNNGKSYVSQLLNNDCKISMYAAEKIKLLTHLSFDDFLDCDGKPDTREFYGGLHILEGKPLSQRNYYRELRKQQRQEKPADLSTKK